MGGVGSGRRPRDKSKVSIEEYRERQKRKQKATQLEQPEGRLFSGPEHVEEIRTSSAIRFKG